MGTPDRAPGVRLVVTDPVPRDQATLDEIAALPVNTPGGKPKMSDADQIVPGLRDVLLAAGRADLDYRDAAILVDRYTQVNAVRGPRVGDYVRFSEGGEGRIAHDGAESDGGLQWSAEGGSFYLGESYVSYSGSLQSAIPHDECVLTDETKLGSVWFFHHDIRRAHNGVDVEIPFRVYTVARTAEEAR